MNKCAVCGAEFEGTVRFCAVCGAKLSDNTSEAFEQPIVESISDTTTPVSEPLPEVVTSTEVKEESPLIEESEADDNAFGFVEDYVSETPVVCAPTFGVYYPKKPNSGKWWKVLLSVTAGVIAVIMMFISFVTVYIPMVLTSEYSKGEVKNGVYVNEFSDLYFEMGTRWKNASKSDYAECEKANGENCECGLYVTRDTTEVIVMYISGASGNDGEDILNNSAAQYKDKKAMEKALLDDIIRERGDIDGSSVSVNVISVGKVEDTEIADAKFAILSVEYDITLNGTTYKTYRSICARVIGDYAVVIQVSSDSERGVESALKSFKTIPLEYYYEYEYYYDDEDEIEGTY